MGHGERQGTEDKGQTTDHDFYDFYGLLLTARSVLSLSKGSPLTDMGFRI